MSSFSPEALSVAPQSSRLPPLVVFDLDGTLTESKAPLDREMTGLLVLLLQKTKVAIVSGASFAQFETQVIGRFTDMFESARRSATSRPTAAIAALADPAVLNNLLLLPVTGSRFYTHTNSKWSLVYETHLATDEKDQIKKALAKVIASMDGAIVPKPRSVRVHLYGEQIEDRDSQITFSALGQQAPLDEKLRWDPDHTKRNILIAALRPLLPEFEISMGGATSIDITKKGLDKETAIHRLAEYLRVPLVHVIYIGDELFPGGNDYGAVLSGVMTRSVASVAETKEIIRQNFLA